MAGKLANNNLGSFLRAARGMGDENLEANSRRRRKAPGGTEATTRNILELSAAALSFTEVFMAARRRAEWLANFTINDWKI
jgi:hypothetical protein